MTKERGTVFGRKDEKLPKRFALLTILLVLLLFSSCGGDEAEPTPEPTVAPTVAAAEAPTATTSPLAAPESPLAVSNATTGSVVGQIVVNLKAGDKPVQDTIIALANVLRDDQGVAKVAGYDAANAPRTVTDAEGKFQIDNIPPGTYAFILDLVITSEMLSVPGSEDTLLIEVKAGETTSTGLLEYDSLPLPGLSDEE